MTIINVIEKALGDRFLTFSKFHRAFNEVMQENNNPPVDAVTFRRIADRYTKAECILFMHGTYSL